MCPRTGQRVDHPTAFSALQPFSAVEITFPPNTVHTTTTARRTVFPGSGRFARRRTTATNPPGTVLAIPEGFSLVPAVHIVRNTNERATGTRRDWARSCLHVRTPRAARVRRTEPRP